MSKELNLMMHCGGSEVKKGELITVDTPPPTNTWFPIAHHELLGRVETALRRGGSEIIKEAYGLSHDGKRFFGMMHVSNLGTDGAAADDYGLIVGIRNSHDKSFPAGLCLGNGVSVCDNLSFIGEVNLSRKHTRHIWRDLPAIVNRAVGLLGDKRVEMDTRITAYREHELDDRDAHHLVVSALDAGAITATKIPAVLEAYRKPPYEEFEPRNAWSLFNSFTEIYKGDENHPPNPHVTLKRSTALYGLMDNSCGIVTAS